MSRTASGRSRHSLKTLCWNINHSRDKYEGAKVEIPEIRELLHNHDLFALQETKGEVNLSDYICYNSNRKGSNSGGVCIGIHKSLKAGITRVRVNTSEDIVIVKLKAMFFDLEKDTNIVNFYDSSTYGSFKNAKGLNNPTTKAQHLKSSKKYLQGYHSVKT